MLAPPTPGADLGTYPGELVAAIVAALMPADRPAHRQPAPIFSRSSAAAYAIFDEAAHGAGFSPHFRFER